MLLILSPSKTQNFSDDYKLKLSSESEFINKACELNSLLKKFNCEQISHLMNISEKLAKSSFENIQKFDINQARQAILAYTGDVYSAINLQSYTEEDYKFAQEHLRIISGLYGILKPLDMIKPYRLEMSIKLVNKNGKNLYEFWGDKITENINKTCINNKFGYLINLASNEYSDAILSHKLKVNKIDIIFKENKNGKMQIIGLHAKKARGMMADFIIKNRITKIKDIKEFNNANYFFNKELSSAEELIFCR